MSHYKLKIDIMTSVTTYRPFLTYPYIAMVGVLSWTPSSLKTGIRLNSLVPFLMLTRQDLVRISAGMTFTWFSRILVDLKQFAASKRTIAISLYLSAQRQF